MAVEAERGPRARVRWLGLWDGYFVVCHLVTTALVFTSGAPQGRRVLAIGGLTVAAVWYAALGRPLLTGRGAAGGATWSSAPGWSGSSRWSCAPT
ncbi:hypothetical protein [Streptomyces sp. MOE7]|uniref:hypothetical protein n=1 Tax=Streptomyces sp. MOE7 TaxID=1961713 RepID=UPI001F357611|nr:hypothetical protein [Streptomyces sp. MOE7]